MASFACKGGRCNKEQLNKKTMKPQEKKITERDMKFLANYANTYYPLSDLLHDYSEPIEATRGFGRAHDILVKERDAIKKRIAKAKERLQRLRNKYGDRVYDIVSEFDGYSN